MARVEVADGQLDLWESRALTIDDATGQRSGLILSVQESGGEEEGAESHRKAVTRRNHDHPFSGELAYSETGRDHCSESHINSRMMAATARSICFRICGSGMTTAPLARGKSGSQHDD